MRKEILEASRRPFIRCVEHLMNGETEPEPIKVAMNDMSFSQHTMQYLITPEKFLHTLAQDPDVNISSVKEVMEKHKSGEGTLLEIQRDLLDCNAFYRRLLNAISTATYVPVKTIHYFVFCFNVLYQRTTKDEDLTTFANKLAEGLCSVEPMSIGRLSKIYTD